MSRAMALAGLLVTLSTSALPGQEGPRRGIIKEVTADTIVITVDGKPITCTIIAETRWMSADNQPLRPPFQEAGVEAGAAAMFLARERDGKHLLIGLKLVDEKNDRRATGPDQRRGGPANDPGNIRRGKIARLDLPQRSLRLIVNGKEEQFELTEDAVVLGASGSSLRERFAGVKDGDDVYFKVARRDGKSVIVAVKPANDESPAELPKVDADKLVPLTVLGGKEYQGFEGGLYPEGQNVRPAAHEAAGLALARQVQPRNKDGQPAADGAIVLLSIGMSNTSQISQGFQRAFSADQQRSPHVVFVNGAQGGMTASAIQDPDDNGRGTQYWKVLDERLQAAGVTRNQVQVIWIKQADAGPSQGFPRYAQNLQQELTRIVQLLPARFPNIKQVYLSSRTYGGFAKTRLNPEPYAYESAFSVKWLVEQQLHGEASLNYDESKGEMKAPWLSWGPYLWDNGVHPRADGYRPKESDFAGDGTHHANPGIERLGTLLLQFFKTDTTTRPWFVRH
ncbi:MAG: hypothetical protein KDB14_04615 [Planctomycetales bacterium]|nr:hypothetical protein [Planctomycetales bacterium]